MNPGLSRKHPMFRPLAGMTVSILILLSLSYFFIVNASNKLSLNAAIMKITATQRSLSQQIINSIAADNLAGETSGAPLNPLMDSFTELQHLLLYGNKTFNIGPLKKDMLAEYRKLDVNYNRFSQTLDQALENDSAQYFLDLLNAENLYLLQLDQFNGQLTGYSNQKVKNFQLKEVSILCFTLLFIFLQIRFIFLPGIKKIDRQSAALREISFTQSHIIRRPLANIQSLLTLILERPNEDQLSIQLLNLAQSEAIELDTVIKTNIIKSDKTHNG